MSQQFNIKFKTLLSKIKSFSKNFAIKIIVLQNTEEALIFRSTKKIGSKSISAPNVRGDFHIHIAMCSVILTKFFKPIHPFTHQNCQNDILMFVQYEYEGLPLHIEI